MRELREIVSGWNELEGAGRQAVLATVLRTRGSTYRKAGARMLITESAWIAGAISGGCVEGDLLRKAWWRTESGKPTLVTYDGARDRDDTVRWGFGLGCDGTIDVLLERLRPGSPCMNVLRAVVERRVPAVLSTTIGTFRRLALVGEEVVSELPEGLFDSVSDAARAVLRGDGPAETRHGEFDVVHERLAPPMPLVIFGSNHDALPVAQLARALGWDVTLVEKRPSAATQSRFSVVDRVVVGRAPEVVGRMCLDGAAVVVMTHDYEEDRAVLGSVLATSARYVGVLGPRRRTARLLDELHVEGDARVHGPIGLDLGGRSPDEIALSIVAEVQAVMHGRSGRSLAA